MTKRFHGSFEASLDFSDRLNPEQNSLYLIQLKEQTFSNNLDFSLNHNEVSLYIVCDLARSVADYNCLANN